CEAPTGSLVAPVAGPGVGLPGPPPGRAGVARVQALGDPLSHGDLHPLLGAPLRRAHHVVRARPAGPVVAHRRHDPPGQVHHLRSLTGGPAGHDQRRGQGQGGQGATTGHDGTPSPLALSGDEGPSRAVRLATRAARLGRTQPIWITVSPSSPSMNRMPPRTVPAWITTPRTSVTT